MVEASLEWGGSKPSPVQGSPMVVAPLAGDGLSASPCGGGPVEKALLTAEAAAQVRDNGEICVCFGSCFHHILFDHRQYQPFSIRIQDASPGYEHKPII